MFFEFGEKAAHGRLQGQRTKGVQMHGGQSRGENLGQRGQIVNMTHIHRNQTRCVGATVSFGHQNSFALGNQQLSPRKGTLPPGRLHQGIGHGRAAR